MENTVNNLEIPSTGQGILATAIDLYERGLNVFPLPSFWEWQMHAELHPGSGMKKPPYVLNPLFTSRMHRCDENCRHYGKEALSREQWSFDALFAYANLGVMMGHTSGNLAAVECDSQRSFQEMRNRLQERNIPYWSFKSWRGGAYLFRVQEGEIANQPEGKCRYKEVQVWGNRHFLVFPPSWHPASTVDHPIVYQWLTPEPRLHIPRGEQPPAVSIDDLAWLGAKLAIAERGQWEAPDLLGLPEWTSVLSLPNREKLATGADLHSRNYWLNRVACDMRGNNIDRDDAEALLVEMAERCSPPETASTVASMIKSVYGRSCIPARKSFPVRSWQKAQAFGLNYDWSVYGRRRQTARAVFFACVERARMDDSDVFRCSEREGSELANRERVTVRKTLRLLCGYGLSMSR